jgi:hypothetical protein
VTVEAKIPRGARRLLVADGGLVALTGGGDHVCRIERENGTVVARGKLPAEGTVAAVHDDALWVACSRLRSTRWGALARVDLATMAPTEIHELPSAPRAMAAGAGHLWVACGRRGYREGVVVRVSPGSGEVALWAKNPFTVHDLAVAGDDLLAACGVKLSVDVGGGGGGG